MTFPLRRQTHENLNSIIFVSHTKFRNKLILLKKYQEPFVDLNKKGDITNPF